VVCLLRELLESHQVTPAISTLYLTLFMQKLVKRKKGWIGCVGLDCGVDQLEYDREDIIQTTWWAEAVSAICTVLLENGPNERIS
jgi:hypothetical protein